MKKVLVTGGCGFVGRHLIARLLQNGVEVWCVDSLAPFSGARHPSQWPLFQPFDYASFHFFEQDCRDWFREYLDVAFDYSFHLAAMVGGREMIEHNPLAVADDLSIDAHYWQWAAMARPAKNVIFSSSAAYPIELQRADNYLLLKEEMISFEGSIGLPDMSYGWAKLTTEYLARLALEKHGLKSICYRPFSGYGPDQDDTYPFPGICKRILASRGKRVVTVWGSGQQMRDFIHIEDCIDGILGTMDLIDDATALNLSTGIYTSFVKFAKLAAELCGFYPEVHGTSDKPEGVFARGGDITQQTALGFVPKISLRQGIEDALAFYTNNS